MQAIAIGGALLVLATAGAGVALQQQAAGSPDPAAVSRHRDGLWLGHSWVDGRRTAADAAALAGDLRGTGVHDLYLHVGPLEGDGALDRSLRPQAARIVRALHAELPGTRVLAWVGGLVGPGNLDLDSAEVRGRLQTAAGQVLDDGFDGVQYDLEPVRSGDAGLLALLDGTRRMAAERHAIVAVATAKISPLPGLAEATAAAEAGPMLWSTGYLAQVAARVDQVEVMSYDTGLPLASLYGGLVARQTRLALDAVPADTDLLIGVPAYHDENAGHHAAAETVTAALRGVRLGLSEQPDRERFGVALYVDFAATDSDWQAYREDWVEPAGRSRGLTTASSASMKHGRSLNDAVRRSSTPRSCAQACASTSMSYRISRWSATKPIGQISGRRVPDRSIASSRSGPSHGTPVWLADWNANSQGGRRPSSPKRASTRRHVSSSRSS